MPDYRIQWSEWWSDDDGSPLVEFVEADEIFTEEGGVLALYSIDRIEGDHEFLSLVKAYSASTWATVELVEDPPKTENGDA